MPDVTSGLTFAADENGRAPEAPIDAENAAHTEIIREQTAAARQSPSDDSFDAASVKAALAAPDPTSIEAGLEVGDEIGREEREAAHAARMEREYGPDSEPGKAVRDRDYYEQYGRSQERLQEVVMPAFAVLENEDLPDARAHAVLQLTPAERISAIEWGLTDQEELAELVALGAEQLSRNQQIAQAVNEVVASEQEAQDRAVGFQVLAAELGLDDRAAQEFLGEALRRSQESGINLASLPAQAWDVTVRAIAGQMACEGEAVHVQMLKQQVADAQLNDMASGITEAGKPVVERLIVPLRVDYSTSDRYIKQARKAGPTVAEFKQSLSEPDATDTVAHVTEGADEVPAATARKMAALFGS